MKVEVPRLRRLSGFDVAGMAEEVEEGLVTVDFSSLADPLNKSSVVKDIADNAGPIIIMTYGFHCYTRIFLNKLVLPVHYTKFQICS